MNVSGVDKYRGLEVDGVVVVNVVVVFSFRFLRICCRVMDFACVLFCSICDMRYAIYTNSYQPVVVSAKLVKCI